MDWRSLGLSCLLIAWLFGLTALLRFFEQWLRRRKAGEQGPRRSAGRFWWWAPFREMADWLLTAPRIGTLPVLLCGFLAFAPVPFGVSRSSSGTAGWMIAADFELGVAWTLMMSALAAVWAGIAAHSEPQARWSRGLLEFTLIQTGCVAGIVLASGSFRLDRIVFAQAEQGVWLLFSQPLMGVLFLVGLMRQSFGFRSFSAASAEVRSMSDRDGLFSRCSAGGLWGWGAVLHGLCAVYLFVLMFLGGWHVWWLAPPLDADSASVGSGLVRWGVLHCKVVLVLAGLVWWHTGLGSASKEVVAWVQMGWNGAVPLGMLNLFVVAISGQLFPRDEMGMRIALAWCVLAAVVGTLGARRAAPPDDERRWGVEAPRGRG